jgi:hypothetical protein
VADLTRTFGLVLPEHGHDHSEHRELRVPQIRHQSIKPGAWRNRERQSRRRDHCLRVTPQAQNTGISLSATGTGSP